ncbi:MAG: CoA transferase [Tetrasphaera sp.]
MTSQPLAGIRVLEFGGYIAGPFGTSLLCSLGAEVIKVEKPVVGDDFRRGVDDRSPYFRQYNAGKRSLSVDLKTPEGVSVVHALVPSADVIVENLRPGVLDRLGLGAQDCALLNPRLVYTSVTGFGSGGPKAQRPAYDTIGQAVGGLYSLLGDRGQAQLSGVILSDMISGVCVAMGVMAGLIGRGDHADGPRVQTSLMEAVTLLTTDQLTQYYDIGEDPVRQSRHPQAQNFCVESSDGKFIAVHLSSSQKFWAQFMKAIGRPDLLDDSRFVTYDDRVKNYFELVPYVAEQFRLRDQQDWERVLTDFDVPFAPVHGAAGFIEDEQTRWLELMEPEQDGLGLVRPPWTFDGERARRDRPTPRVGADTAAILAEVLDAAEVDRIIASGVAYSPRR